MNDSKTSNDSGKSKHKKKVSFSIFEISTFDELAKLRKMREEQLDYFEINKKKTNQYLNNLNQRNKILSLSNNELISLDNNNNNTNSNENISRNYHVKKNINIPKPIRKEVSPDDSNTISNIVNKNKNNINVIKKTLFSDDEEDMKSNELFPSIPQYNSIEKKEMLSDINIFKPPNIIDSINNNTNTNLNYIQNNNLSINNIDELKNNNINNLNSINNNKISENENKEDNNENNVDNNILFETNKNDINNNEINNDVINKDEMNNDNINNDEKNNSDINNNDINNKNIEENIDENNNIDVEENNNINNNNFNNNNMNIISLFNTLEKIFNDSQTFKLYFINEFFINLKNYIEYKYDLYLDYESTDPSFAEEVEKKSELVRGKIYYTYFINTVKNITKKNLIYKEHKIKAKKYQDYLNYKYKAYAFNNLYTFGKKQKEWIKSIQIGFKKKLVWDCIDSLKLYANYKKIKYYLKAKKKKKIFDVLKNNKQLSIKLLKNGKKLNLIFEYRHFFNNCRKKILAKKGKEINDKLVEEFRNQNLMKNIFQLIKLNCDIKKAKKNKYDNIMMKNKINNEFINIKVTTKETVKFNNGNTLMRIQNKINVIK